MYELDFRVYFFFKVGGLQLPTGLQQSHVLDRFSADEWAGVDHARMSSF